MGKLIITAVSVAILMTAFSTVAGMIPIAIGLGEGAESRAVELDEASVEKVRRAASEFRQAVTDYRRVRETTADRIEKVRETTVGEILDAVPKRRD